MYRQVCMCVCKSVCLSFFCQSVFFVLLVCIPVFFLSICRSVCLLVCMSIFYTGYSSVIFLNICLSVNLQVCMYILYTVYLSVILCVGVSFFWLFVCMLVCLYFFCLFVCLLVCPSVCAQVWCCCVVQKQNKNHPKGSIKISPPHYI